VTEEDGGFETMKSYCKVLPRHASVRWLYRGWVCRWKWGPRSNGIAWRGNFLFFFSFVFFRFYTKWGNL